MTNYHPDPQRAYESHCADGYVVPDDETGPQEAAGATVRDFPCCDAPRGGEAAERRTEDKSVIKHAARVLHAWDVEGGPCEGPWEELTGAQREVWRSAALRLADAGLLADPEREVAWLRKVERRTAERDRARDALDETLDDLTRTLARAEKAEAELAAKDEEIARLDERVSARDALIEHREEMLRDRTAERDRARDTAAALEAENARLTAKVERVEVLAATLRKEDRSMTPCAVPNCGGCVRGRDAARICAALSDTTGEATR